MITVYRRRISAIERYPISTRPDPFVSSTPGSGPGAKPHDIHPPYPSVSHTNETTTNY